MNTNALEATGLSSTWAVSLDSDMPQNVLALVNSDSEERATSETCFRKFLDITEQPDCRVGRKLQFIAPGYIEGPLHTLASPVDYLKALRGIIGGK